MTPCTVWAGNRNQRGYGVLGRRPWLAHRVVWAFVHGPIPPGMFVLHRCDNPPCVNVAHLYMGTHADNMRDMVARRRSTKGHRRREEACRHGHPFDDPNTYIRPDGARACRACLRAAVLRYDVKRGRRTRPKMSDRTECPQGHPYDEANTYYRPDGGRDCRACRRAASARYAQKRLLAS